MSCSIVIDTKKVNNITSTTADTGGLNIISTDSIIEKGIVYSYINLYPTVSDTKKVFSGKGVGKFDVRLTALTPGLTYYVRAYAVNSKGDIGYGGVKTFIIPQVSSSVCSLNVSVNPGQMYSVPAGYTLIGSTDNTSITSSCIDTTKLEDLTYTCQGFLFAVVNRDPIAYLDEIHLLGINIQGIDYPFGTIANIVDGSNCTPIINTSLSSNSYLQSLIKLPSLSTNINDNEEGMAVVVIFKGHPTIFKDAYVYYYGNRMPTNSLLTARILPLDDLKTQTGLTTLNCP
jgi:hypothetical protein